MAQACKRANSIGAGYAVPVRVLYSIEPAIGPEGTKMPVMFFEPVTPSRHCSEIAPFPGLAQMTSGKTNVAFEHPDRSGPIDHMDFSILHLDAFLPIVGPTPTERSHLKTPGDRDLMISLEGYGKAWSLYQGILFAG